MADPARRFEIVEDDHQAPGPQGERATDLLLLALKTFSAKTVHALESCFSLFTVALVFWAALSILTPGPSINQLVGLGILSAFVLIANFLVLKRGR